MQERPAPRPGATQGESAITERRAILMGLLAYLLWGFSVLPFKWVAEVPPLEVVAHRFLWSGLALGLLLWATARLGEVRAALADPRLRRLLPISALLIATNATIYVVGVVTDRVLEVSFGYFMAPLALVAVGAALLGERPNGAQGIALSLSALACLILLFGLERTPWLGFLVTATWAAYAYLRKRAPIAAVPAFFLECVLICAPALALILYHEISGSGHFLISATLSAKVVTTALVTALPLILFATANTRLRLTTMGQMQYIAPSIQFLLGVIVFAEPASPPRLAAFALIWLALAVFTLDMLRRQRMTGGIAAR